MLLANGKAGIAEARDLLTACVTADSTTEDASMAPRVHELRAQIAIMTGDDDGYRHARQSAIDEWAAIGASGWVELMDREIVLLCERHGLRGPPP